MVTMLGLVAFGVLMAAVAYRQEQKRAAHRDVLARLHAPSRQQGRRIVATTSRDQEAA